MINQQKKILIWVLTWASLLLAVLYSPIGSPELYTGPVYYIPDQGVNFNSNQIANSTQSKQSNYADNGTQETAIPEYTNESQKNNANSVSSSAESSHSDYTPIILNDNTSSQSNKSAPANGGAMEGGFILSGNRSGNNTTTSQSSGFLALSTDLSSTANTGTRQAAGASTSGTQGSTDPGGDPTGPPIPVGDGWIFLLVLATGYTLRKLKHIKKITKISII